MIELLPGYTIEFREVQFLWLAVLAPIVFYALIRSPGSVTFSSQRMIPRSARSWRRLFAWVPALLGATGALCLAVAAAGPRVGDETTQVQQEGISIALVVDVSGSMNFVDMDTGRALESRRTRLEILRDVIVEFAQMRENDLIGLVTFGKYAETACPFTPDTGNLVQVIRQLEIYDPSHDDHSRTAIGEGIGLACEKLEHQKTATKIAILLTDGANNSGELSPEQATELAKALGIKVYTIGIGSSGQSWMRVPDPRTGNPTLQGPYQIQAWEPERLERIATETGGSFFRAIDEESLQQVYEQIDELERTETRQLRYVVYHEKYAPWVWASLAFIGVSTLLAQTVWRRIP